MTDTETVAAARPPARSRGDFRSRLLAGLAEEIAHGSYRTSTVAGIVRRAQTSRRTFYQHFTDRDECFLVLMTEETAEMIRQVSAAVDRDASWPEQVRAAVEAWFRYAEAEPGIILAWIRDVPASGRSRGSCSGCCWRVFWRWSTTWARRPPGTATGRGRPGRSPPSSSAACANWSRPPSRTAAAWPT
ncbi:TetR/AcrR family transcriptional regulator [Saccharomonospora sp. CUA-673]|uniref:TetR/AcrR family transcriptional regulator n=1 Tax=Saccharomonospora sp. CUA-673 TaxID=1904969 RepID=UPI0021017E76|nr:TetR/AcrR family transcriptional regulator [Saccharomonospora sp. CUA-673]